MEWLRENWKQAVGLVLAGAFVMLVGGQVVNYYRWQQAVMVDLTRHEVDIAGIYRIANQPRPSMQSGQVPAAPVAAPAAPTPPAVEPKPPEKKSP
jgi:hypothetical protein